MDVLNVLITGVMTLIALLPAVTIYYLFPGNSADVSLAGQAIKLGGPIAAFVATFLILAHFYNRLAAKSAELPVLVKEKVGPLAGIWHISSWSGGPTGARRISTVKITAVATGIDMTGGSFEEPPESASPGKLVGQWNCDVAFFDGHRLVYIYDLDDRGDHKGRHRGFVDAQLEAGSAPPCFKGTWETLGDARHSGSITLTKQA
jgi:hypothetical protein